MNIWHDISPERISPEQFIACIEISSGNKNKYELDKETGMLILDRVLYTSTHYPANYGFIPRTYADDGDPLDVLVLCREEIAPLTLVNCYPIGVIKMQDNHAWDEKIIAIPMKDPFIEGSFIGIPMKDPSMNGYRDILDLPRHTFDEISHFFEVYKSLEHIDTTVTEVLGHTEAIKIISDCIESYNKKFVK